MVNEIAKTINLDTTDFKMDVLIDPINKRVRVEFIEGTVSNAIQKAEQLAKENNAEKLIALGRTEQYMNLLEQGLQPEGIIDGYFLGEDAFYFSRFLTLERKKSEQWLVEDGIIKSVTTIDKRVKPIDPPKDYLLRKMNLKDAPSLASLYKQVFQIYPTPLREPAYIQKTMNEGTVYFGFYKDGEIVSAASAEINNTFKNAELTDCATLKEHRKYGLLKLLLIRLEKELIDREIYCAYSIARSLSFGMNAALFQLDYRYRGRLMNNCFIYDKLEDMNIWVKNLAPVPKNQHTE